MERSPRADEEGQPEPHLARRLGQRVFELDSGDFVFIIDTRQPVDKTETLAAANQTLFTPDTGTSMADYEALGVISRETLIEAKPFIPDEG